MIINSKNGFLIISTIIILIFTLLLFSSIIEDVLVEDAPVEGDLFNEDLDKNISFDIGSSDIEDYSDDIIDEDIINSGISIIYPRNEFITRTDQLLQIDLNEDYSFCWFSIDGLAKQKLYKEGNSFYTKLISLSEETHIVNFECSKTEFSEQIITASIHFTVKPLCYPGERKCDDKFVLYCSDDGDMWLTKSFCSSYCNEKTLSCNSNFDDFVPSEPDRINIYLRTTALALIISLAVIIFLIHKKHLEFKEKLSSIEKLEDEDIEKLGEMKS